MEEALTPDPSARAGEGRLEMRDKCCDAQNRRLARVETEIWDDGKFMIQSARDGQSLEMPGLKNRTRRKDT